MVKPDSLKEFIIKGKFMNVPVESNTVILFEEPHTIGGIEVLYQIWRWENYQNDYLSSSK